MTTYTETMPDWDADRYHRLSEPQVAWGRAVLGRLRTSAGERVLDLGCGTGRLTAELAARPGLFTIGLDRSASMLAAARAAVPDVPLLLGDGAALPLSGAVDAVFSAATFHWIPDHDRLFASIHAALRPGGRLVAQCGGGPNLERLLARAHALMDGAFAPHFAGWRDPWHFAGVEATRTRLAAAGFSNVEVWLDPAPTTFPDAGSFSDFISCVCVRHHVDRLPAAERGAFIAALASSAAADDPPFTLDYWRLNLAGVKAAHA